MKRIILLLSAFWLFSGAFDQHNLHAMGNDMFAHSDINAGALDKTKTGVLWHAQMPEGYIIKQTGQLRSFSSFECLPCAIPENEPDIQDNEVDVVNGGCNFEPHVFTDISIGDVYCGRGNQYFVNGVANRDTDWYRLVLTETKTLYWSAIANFMVSIIIIQGPCPGLVIESLGSLTPGTVGTISAELEPGEYYFWVGPAAWGPEFEGDYMVTLTDSPPADPWCYRVLNANTGEHFSTIQSVIDDSQTLPGHDIKIITGNYIENVNDFKGVNFLPGSSPGCVVVDGDFTVTPTTSFTMEIEGEDESACEYDRFEITGVLTLNESTLIISLGSYTPPVGAVYTLFRYGELSGTFSNPELINAGDSYFILNYGDEINKKITLTVVAPAFKMEINTGGGK